MRKLHRVETGLSGISYICNTKSDDMGKIISIRMDEELHSSLVKYALEHGRSVSKVISHAVRCLLGEAGASAERSTSVLVKCTPPVPSLVKTLKTDKPTEKGRFNIWSAMDDVRGE